MLLVRDDKTRYLLWDAKMERKYGNPILRYIADNDPSSEDCYYEWRAVNQSIRYEKCIGMTMFAVSLIFAALSLLMPMLVVAQMMFCCLAFFGFSCAATDEVRRDFLQWRFLREADLGVKEKAYEKLMAEEDEKYGES